MQRSSLRFRLLLATSTIAVGLIAATLVYVGVQANGFVSDRIADDLRRTEAQIRTHDAQRFAELGSTADVLASFPELRALLATDAPTVRDFLLDYQTRVGGVDLLIALDPSGAVVARSDTISPLAVPEAESRWVRPALAGERSAGLLAGQTGTYAVAAAPAAAGGAVFGFLLVGVRVDDSYAARLRDVTGEEIVVVGPGGVLGSTIDRRRLPDASSRDWQTLAGGADRASDLSLGGERYAGRAAQSQAGADLLYFALQSRDRAMAPYRRIQAGLLALGLLGAVLGVAASAWLARWLTSPLHSLMAGTRRVAAGEFDFSLDLERDDEIGELAKSFNLMTRGLRERSEMQKFVSQSTVAMIRDTPAGPAASGERKLLTILISDIRGFSTYAETRAPEDVVSLLNWCFGVQASVVKRFGGDIDKYVGDSVVAVFSGEDMALRAIRCAVEIHRALGTSPGHEPLQLGIGLATGEVVLGSIGGENRFDYTVVGAHVNLASRLCAMASGREVLMADSTYREVSALVSAERSDAVPIRGLNQPVAVYRMRVAS